MIWITKTIMVCKIKYSILRFQGILCALIGKELIKLYKRNTLYKF